jgi:hypothetical protein
VGNTQGYDNKALAARRRDNFIDYLKKIDAIDANPTLVSIIAGGTKVGKATVQNSPEAQKEQYVSAAISTQTTVPVTGVEGDNTNVADPNYTGKGPKQTKYQLLNYQPKLLRELGYSANEEDARRERMLEISSYLLEFQLMLLNLAPRKKQDQKYPLLKNLRKSPAEEANDMIYRNYRKLQRENPDLELRFFTERFLPSFSQANLQFKHGFIGAISEEQQRKAEEEDRKFAERAILEWVAEVPLRAVEYAIAFPGLKIEGVAQAGVALLPQKF